MIGTAIGGCSLWGLALTAAMSRWLLRPFQPRQILDHRFPLRTRAVLAVLVLAAALPMGG